MPFEIVRNDIVNIRQKIGRIDFGDVVITTGFNLDAKYVIHTVRSVYLPRQCLRDGAKALSLLGFLDGNLEFTPLEDRIGIVRTGKAWDESYVLRVEFIKR